MWKKIAISALSLWILTIAGLSYVFINGAVKTGDDDRMSIGLQAEEKALVLSEMRQFLSGIQSILEGLANDDMKVVQLNASSLGMNAAVDVNPSLMAKLPLDFKSTGMGVHRRFDELATMVQNGAKKEEIISEVSDILRTCVGCHEAYRLDEVK